MGAQERRKFPRIKSELLVRYKVLETPEQEVEAQTKDISEGGLCLVAREHLISGSVLALEVKFPHSKKPIVACGTVVWSKPSSLGISPGGHPRFDNGIEFKDISVDDRQRINEMVAAGLDKQGKTEDWKIGIVKDFAK
ncbi:PilZ domain-containing protein [Candidatus Omnitrophota bacterium]